MRPLGSPFVSRSHLLPPSVVRYIPLSGPPELIVQGLRSVVHIAAIRMFGFFGSIVRSTAPVRSLRKWTFCQVLPPSLER